MPPCSSPTELRRRTSTDVAYRSESCHPVEPEACSRKKEVGEEEANEVARSSQLGGRAGSYSSSPRTLPAVTKSQRTT